MTTTTIVCKLKKPGQVAQPGLVRVTLAYPLKDESVIYTPTSTDFELVNGEVTFTLLSTDISQVLYNFKVIETSLLIPEPEEGEEESADPIPVETVIWQFDALVPYSATPVDLADLFEASGIPKDYKDQSVLNLVRYLSYNQKFIDSILERIFKHQGVWSNVAIYRIGNLVSNGGHTYIYVNRDPSTGVALSDNLYWRLLV